MAETTTAAMPLMLEEVRIAKNMACEKWLYSNLKSQDFWHFYNHHKDYTRMPAQQLAELCAIGGWDFWTLTFQVGFGCEAITINEVERYYYEMANGFTVGTMVSTTI